MLDKLRHVIVVLTAVCTIVFVVLFVSSLIHGYRFAWEKKIEYMEKKNAGFISENDRSLERELRAKGIVKADVLSDNKNNTSINKEASNNEEQTYLPMLVTVPNPSPDSLPTLAVWQSSTELRVAATFPNVPDFTCDFWCYESAMDCIGIKALEEGQLGLWHLDRNTPEIMYVTTVIPHSDSIEFIVKAQVAPGSDGPLPDKLQAPNICWQLKRAPAFASAPESYPEFFKRCFIFTEDGIGFLGDVPRHPIPCRPLTDKENNPPWVQMYVGA